MKFWDLVTTAQNNLLRSKVRTTLTVLAVLIGTTTLQLTTALGEGGRTYIDQQVRAKAQPDTLFISAKSSSSAPNPNNVPEYQENATKSNGESRSLAIPNMSQLDLQKISGTPNIKSTYPDYHVQANYIQLNKGKKYVIGLDSLYPSTTIALAAGTLPAPEDKTSVILPYRYITALGFSKPDDLLGKNVTIQIPNSTNQKAKAKNVSLVVTAISVNSITSQQALISYQLVKDLASFQTDNQPTFTDVYAINKSGLSSAEITSLKSKLLDLGYDSLTYQDQIANYKQPLNIVQIALSLFAAVALLAASLGIINTLLMSVLERVQEIGLMKALGMRRSGIFLIFSIEAISIGFWGGVLGAALAIGVGRIIDIIAAKTFLQNVEGFTLLVFNPLNVLVIIAGAMLLGFLAGVIPAIRASKLDPIEALRRE
jgi:putative ABC transport system permease protein